MSSRLSKARSGSGHAYAIDGQRVPSVTTVLSNSVPKPALVWSAAKLAAEWGATHVDLLPALGEPEWVESATKAHQREWYGKATRGTDVHGWAAAALAGAPVEIPAEYEAIVRHAVDFMDTWHVREVAAERPCYNAKWRYAGTFDLLAHLDTATGRELWLLDWKTGKGPYPEQSLQLAAYASCDFYQDDNGDDVPMPTVDRMGFVMLSDDGWELVPVTAKPADLLPVFARAIGVANFVQRTKVNRDGHAAWPVLGEPIPSSAVAS